jgi:hypothetical protein
MTERRNEVGAFYRAGASRGGLRPEGRKRRSDEYPDDESEYQRQGLLHEFLLVSIMKVAIFVPLR